MTIWGWIDRCFNWDLQWFQLFSRLAKLQCGYINWVPYLDFIFTRLIRATGLATGASKLVRISHQPYSRSCSLFTGAKKLYLLASKLLCYSITTENAQRVLPKLKQFFTQFQSYFHHSNSGSWSYDLSLLVHRFTHYYLNRNREGKVPNNPLAHVYGLPSEINEEVTRIFLPVLHLGVYCKNSKMSYSTSHCLGQFLCFSPTLVFNTVFPRASYILNSIFAGKEISETICLLSKILVRPFFDSVMCLEQLPGLMMQMLLVIDLNDVTKTTIALHFYQNFLSRVPLFEFVGGVHVLPTTVSTDFLSKEVLDARLGVVEILSDWSISFLDRILEFLRHSEQVDMPRTFKQTVYRDLCKPLPLYI
eukprot:TRINITY_DN3933_c0_g2_i4.p1 TRINITY_DN3933_c0_g2~~TRINITY_DN3933_c0_g2_i4.p1  ORF type:complete len:362 (+),score=58.98 TRINITY_DN3933_c0_g2_i4:790-1875(+)